MGSSLYLKVMWNGLDGLTTDTLVSVALSAKEPLSSSRLLCCGSGIASQSVVHSSPLCCAELIMSFSCCCSRALSPGVVASMKALCVYFLKESGHPEGWPTVVVSLLVLAFEATRVKATGGGPGCSVGTFGGGGGSDSGAGRGG